MNKLVKHRSPPNFFCATFVSVQAITSEGAPYTFGVIYRSKHKRTNLIRVDGVTFMAGGRNQKDVEKYARTVDPNTADKYFIQNGQLIPIPLKSS